MNGPIPTEHDEQVVFMRHMFYKHRNLEPYLYAIPNGGLRNKTVAAKLKAEGVKSGVPDLFLSLPMNGYHGLYIEMKRQKGGKVSQDQKDMIQMLKDVGYAAEIALGADDALRIVEEYISDNCKSTE